MVPGSVAQALQRLDLSMVSVRIGNNMESHGIMDIWRISIPKAKLNELPEHEQIFFVQASNLLNDLNTLQKCLLYSNYDTDSEIEKRSQTGQALFFARLTAAKCWEGWQMLQKSYFGTRLSQEYQRQLSAEGLAELENLKRYFSRENLIDQVRNRFEFHMPEQQALKEFLGEVPDDEVFEVYIAESQGNCRYQLADVVVTFALMKTIPTDRKEAMLRLLKEPVDVTGHFLGLLGGWMKVFLGKQHLEARRENLPDPPLLQEVKCYRRSSCRFLSEGVPRLGPDD